MNCIALKHTKNFFYYWTPLRDFVTTGMVTLLQSRFTKLMLCDSVGTTVLLPIIEKYIIRF